MSKDPQLKRNYKDIIKYFEWNDNENYVLVC